MRYEYTGTKIPKNDADKYFGREEWGSYDIYDDSDKLIANVGSESEAKRFIRDYRSPESAWDKRH